MSAPGFQQQDDLFAALLATAVDGIIVIDPRGLIQVYNQACERLFGYLSGEAVGQNIKLLMPELHHRDHDGYLTRDIHERRIIGIGREVVGRRKDGSTFPMYLSVGEGGLAGQRFFVGIIRDLTDIKRTEASRLALQDELAHVGRLGAMGQMSAAIAHEINQPLTAIANYAKAAQRLLAGDSPAPAKLRSARDAMEKAAAQTLRAGTIIRHLRDFVDKRESARLIEDLNHVIREAATLGMQGDKYGKISLSLILDPAVPPVAIDKVQIQQALLNLIRNAAEALAAVAQPELTITSSLDEAGVRIVIRDNGPGFAPEIAGRLFQPFVTTKEDGMGIGLKICQSIVEAHGGTIEGWSGDPGAVFEICLPLAVMPTEKA
ncbi:MAG TPA: PAS domain S-box protein [Rhizomicrobium sp.]|nr:PAS domain S-box protein [Rhizomicrobium sp.]